MGEIAEDPAFEGSPHIENQEAFPLLPPMDRAHETVRLGRESRAFEKEADSQRGSWELPNVHLPANKPPTAYGAVKSASKGQPGAGRLQ